MVHLRNFVSQVLSPLIRGSQDRRSGDLVLKKRTLLISCFCKIATTVSLLALFRVAASAQTPPAAESRRVSEPLRELSWLRDDRGKRSGHTDLHPLPHRRGSDCRHSRAPRNTPAMSLHEAELRQILTAMRELAGTNPAMATGGFTGRRGGGPGGGGGGRGAGSCARSRSPAGARSSSGLADHRASKVCSRRRSRWPTADHEQACCLRSRRSPPCSQNRERAAASTRFACSRKTALRIAKKPSRRKRTGRTTTAASRAIATVRSS